MLKLPVKRERLVNLMILGLLAVYDLSAILGSTVLALMLRFEHLRLDYLGRHAVSTPANLVDVPVPLCDVSSI